MQLATALVLLVTCELCLAIRVPVEWDQSASEVKQEISNDNDEQFSVESFKPQNFNTHNEKPQDEKPIPVEYFQYTAKKPQFAVDIAKFHGVQSPENHYKSYPIKPYTGQARPELGKHHLLDKENTFYRPLQEFANSNADTVSHAVPVSSNYEVFHPYEAETPALQELYKDPILNKIRNDLENSKNKLQKYENEAGEPDIHKDEYLESPKKTNNRFIPHRNVPAPYEIHRPQRRPIYYRPGPKYHQREHYLNQKLRHPWNQYSAKIRPIQYRPIKNHIHKLRQNHALKYDDERNEYPQVQILENYSSDPKEGYDIYERGKEKYVKLRNNVDESINKAVQNNRPATYQKLEVQNNDYTNKDDDDDDEEEEFVPIKNYAQVRKTESYKHLPRSAALADADTLDEISNAPRLREAVKSTKAQTVYSEEGYEDTAYDHAGEQKHASENEGHGGYLKEHELSGGKYKTPSESAKYEDGGGSAYRDQVIHAEKWKDDNENNKEQTDGEDYSEDDHEKLIEADEYKDKSPNDDDTHRNKRDYDMTNYTKNVEQSNKTNSNHTLDKRNVNFKVPEIDLNSTFLTEKEILKLSKLKIEPKITNVKQKYPYYFQNLKTISKHSPLRYAENMDLIPRKSKGGTEFYDSRSVFQCPEVDDVPDPLPEKLKSDGHPDDKSEEDSSDKNYDTVKKTPRLKGLGDKIDCFKAKYFGENPLDSPFFKEDIISNPEPVIVSKLSPYFLQSQNGNNKQKKYSNASDTSKKQEHKKNLGIFDILEKLKEQNYKPELLLPLNKELNGSLVFKSKNNNDSDNLDLKQQSNVYSDVLQFINNKSNMDNEHSTAIYLINPTKQNASYSFYKNKEDITQTPPTVRNKRSTSFVYEPYKIIRDGQVQDSKKTTTTSNISPLIRQLQSRRIIDRLAKPNQEEELSAIQVKRNVNSRIYKDIGKNERETRGSKNDKGLSDPEFIDISVDSRRGEPRYEIKNHKSRYTPVENKKFISVEDYKAQTGVGKMEIKSRGESDNRKQSRLSIPPAFTDSDLKVQNVAASSNNVRKTISATTEKNVLKSAHSEETSDGESESDAEYEEYGEEDDELDITTTTTLKPNYRRKGRTSTTTEKYAEITEKPKLKLVTRFRDHNPAESSHTQDAPVKFDLKSNKVNNEPNTNSDGIIPKYRIKKTKSDKSTLVTDTKKYGNNGHGDDDDDDDDDMQKAEVDALIGVKQDMDDYMPLYEKEEKRYINPSRNSKNVDNNNKKQDYNDEDTQSHENDNDDTDDSNEDDFEDDDDDSEADDDENNQDDEEEDDENDENDNAEHEPPITTSEPTKRTLAITTDAPVPTVASRNFKLENKPIVTRKKIEIHKELPANKSLPHVTQFKQDIKEVEIIKEIPIASKRKPQKNLEALELYKDDSLAKDVNKLGGVEIFKQNLDLKNGPKHGGNYRILVEQLSTNAPLIEGRSNKIIKEDAEASQSEFTKQIELEDVVPSNRMHGGNLKSLDDAYKPRNRGRNSKLIEHTTIPSALHGGHIKSNTRNRNSGRNQKLIELDENNDNDDDRDTSRDHESFSNSRNSGPMHGGNYRSAKIVADDEPKISEQITKNKAKDARRNSAAILNSFVQAAPIFTTTPGYILDPSKRMYYYVDA